MGWMVVGQLRLGDIQGTSTGCCADARLLVAPRLEANQVFSFAPRPRLLFSGMLLLWGALCAGRPTWGTGG